MNYQAVNISMSLTFLRGEALKLNHTVVWFSFLLLPHLLILVSVIVPFSLLLQSSIHAYTDCLLLFNLIFWWFFFFIAFAFSFLVLLIFVFSQLLRTLLGKIKDDKGKKMDK